MEFVCVSIVLCFFLTGLILRRSTNDSDMYELPERASKGALYFTPFTLIIATGYVTLVLVVTKFGSSLLSANLSHTDVGCLFLHFKQVLSLWHSVGLWLSPYSWNKIFIAQYFSMFKNHGFCSFTISRSMVRFLTVHFSKASTNCCNF